MSRSVLGVDIGGTFTDFVLVHDGRVRVHKRLSTPSAPEQALLEGAAYLALPQEADVVHGSTIATNALLERRGARTALITTRGFADLIDIGRQDRPDLYALVPHKPAPLVPSDLRLEVDERIGPDGQVIRPLTDEALDDLRQRIDGLAVEAVAICLLFSFLNPDHERQVRDALGGRCPVSLSCEVLPEHREYERLSTTVINAYVSPLMDRYLSRVEAGLAGRRLRIMQSNGGVITAETARREAARTALSGPAAGAVGAFHVARLAGYDHIISFDMGGTSTDVAIFPGEMLYTREMAIERMPLRLPVVDVHTVGAGGGSIAQVDPGGALQVGPQSAGADPGPACYGRGVLPTTSDANLVLGRLHPQHFLGGAMPLYPERARRALADLAGQIGAGAPEEAAWGVIQVANASMERAIRRVSVERGYDPRDFTLVPFGGAGPLHACALAEALRIPRVLVPRLPGVLSALGMTIADLVKDYSQAVMAGADSVGQLENLFGALEDRARRDLIAEGIAADDISLGRILEMRYRGQSHEIAVAQPEGMSWLEGFHAAHQRRYGHRHDDLPVEIVNARLRAVGRTPKPTFEPLSEGGPSASAARAGKTPVWFSSVKPTPTTLYLRERLLAGNRLVGPAVIFQLDATTVLPPGWQAVVDQWGNLILHHETA
ncbi:MAG: hydantoinase/oxoprolinase family protein [Anaerolineae bacterium]